MKSQSLIELLREYPCWLWPAVIYLVLVGASFAICEVSAEFIAGGGLRDAERNWRRV